MKKFLLGCGAAAGIFGILLVASLLYLGMTGPETFVVSGRQLDKRFLDKVRELELLEEDETIQYFYSDALADITGGFYLVTERHLVLYSEQWAEPRIVLPFEEIYSLEAEFDDSFFIDSVLTVGLADGSSISFPVSSERGGDQRFYDHIVQHSRREAEEAPAAAEAAEAVEESPAP